MDWREKLTEAIKGVVDQWSEANGNIHVIVDCFIDEEITVNVACFEREMLPPGAYQRLTDLLSEITSIPVEVALLRPTMRFRDRTKKSSDYWVEWSDLSLECGELWKD